MKFAMTGQENDDTDDCLMQVTARKGSHFPH
jgi:hypothetical protein